MFWRFVGRFFGNSMTRLSAVAFMQLPVADQWDKPVQWDLFSKVPKVLVFGGRDAALPSREWGAYVQKNFNGGFMPSPSHLQELKPEEKIKVVAVATLPDVPGMFKYLFRAGFRKEAKEMGLVLDFSGRLSGEFGYKERDKDPKVVLLSASNEIKEQFVGPPGDVNLQSKLSEAIKLELKKPQ